MKLTWRNNTNSSQNKNKRPTISNYPNLPFETQHSDDESNLPNLISTQKGETTNAQETSEPSCSSDAALADHFLEQGNKLADEGKYCEALGKWETAITLMPAKALLHEQKAQVLLEIGDAWGALKAANRATELEPSWAEAWITLGRAQLNFGEPDSAIESFDKALQLKPESIEAQDDRQTASQLVKKRKLLHLSGAGTDRSRFVVGNGLETSTQA